MTDFAAHPAEWISFARTVIELAVRGDDYHSAPAPESAPRNHGGVFVTLKKFGRLRGCMGILDPSEVLGEAVRMAACSAALRDSRFRPVEASELPDLRLDVSILSKPWRMKSAEELVLGEHGIIVRSGMRRGLFLPQVATEHNLDKDTFLSRCCSEKAGLASDAWRHSDTEVMLFTAEVIQE